MLLSFLPTIALASSSLTFASAAPADATSSFGGLSTFNEQQLCDAFSKGDTNGNIIFPVSDSDITLQTADGQHMRQSGDAMQSVVVSLAYNAGIPSMSFFPAFPGQSRSYGELTIRMYSQSANTMTYKDAVDALRGFGEFMTTKRLFDVRRIVVVVKGGHSVGLMAMEIGPGMGQECVVGPTDVKIIES